MFQERLAQVLPFGRRGGRRATYTLRARDSLHPLHCRYGSSDRSVFNQIFIGREYACLEPSDEVRVIVDGGANVGYSSAYFLKRYRRARIYCIEPDTRNFEILELNTRHFGERVHRLRAGLWSSETGLKVEMGLSGEGQEWATTVRASRPDETPDLLAIDIGSLMRKFGFDHIDILKLDIEGAEAVVFSENFASWIDKVRIFVIEVHGPHCKQVFLDALKTGDFRVYPSGELLIAERRGARERLHMREHAWPPTYSAPAVSDAESPQGMAATKRGSSHPSPAPS
ncbi:MAG: methyltransferase, FkbM family [Bryobacterales bacterium]|nr:methyltransferase, FkbM family [Bryobacterales bacterium]